MARTFLEAEWRKLAMANYTVDPKTLAPYLPYKTELDYWNGQCYVSLVGFIFGETRLKGFKIPFHIRFEKVNLRFYVRHKEEGIWKPALTLVANTVYKEKDVTMPMGCLPNKGLFH